MQALHALKLSFETLSSEFFVHALLINLMSAVSDQPENQKSEEGRYINVKIPRGPKIEKVFSTKRDTGIIIFHYPCINYSKGF